MHRLTVVLVIAALSAPLSAAAEEAPDDSAIVPIEQGERAPFSGQLFPTERAIRMGMMIEQLRLRLDADLERSQQLCDAHLEYRDQVLQIERERYTHDTGALEQAAEELADQLEEARRVPWWRSWGFAFGMGVLASAVLVGAAAALAVSL